MNNHSYQPPLISPLIIKYEMMLKRSVLAYVKFPGKHLHALAPTIVVWT